MPDTKQQLKTGEVYVISNEHGQRRCARLVRSDGAGNGVFIFLGWTKARRWFMCKPRVLGPGEGILWRASGDERREFIERYNKLQA